MKRTSRQDVLQAWPGVQVLVVGDVMLDEYLWGDVRRISPEAPVPVVEIRRRSYIAGGAANTAANVGGLRGRATLLGVIGRDYAGEQLRAALKERGIADDGLLVDPQRPTTTKMRIVAHSQHVVRADCEERAPVSRQIEHALLESAEETLQTAAACVLSDYGKGVVSPRFAERLIAQARRAGKPVIVDPKGKDYRKYRGATLIKPNVHETAQVLNREVNTLADLEKAGLELLTRLDCEAVLITRGAEGMSLFLPGQEPLHIRSQAHAVFDVTGAGDTVAGTLAMALAGGASLPQAASLANSAAGIVVAKVGTTAVMLDELTVVIAKEEEEAFHGGNAAKALSA